MGLAVLLAAVGAWRARALPVPVPASVAAPDGVREVRVAALQAIAAGPAGGSLTGLPLLETQLRELLARDLVRITAASLFAVALLLVVYYRRLRPVLAVLLPLSVAWALFGAALALFGIPLHLYNLLAVPLIEIGVLPAGLLGAVVALMLPRPGGWLLSLAALAAAGALRIAAEWKCVPMPVSKPPVVPGPPGPTPAEPVWSAGRR